MHKLTFSLLMLLPLMLMAQVAYLPFNCDNDTRDGQRAWRIDYMIVEDWNDTEFIANQKTVVVYNQATEGAPQQINNFFWSLDHWVQNANYNYIYGDDSGLIQHTDHNGFSGTSTTPNYKYDYTYDDAHHLTGISMFQYQANALDWVAYKRLHIMYENGFLTSTVEWRNNFGNYAYERYDYEYGTDNKLLSKTRLYCTDSTNWVTTNQDQYTYHANDYTTNNGFLNYYTHTYPITYPLQQSDIPGYSTYGMPLQIINAYYIGGNWMTLGRNSYTYNASNKPTEYLQEVNANGWMNEERWTMTYDINGNPEYQTFQEWNGTSWDNQYRVAYFWNNYTVIEDAAIPAVSGLNFKTYPGPFTTNFRIDTFSKQSQPITLQIFNSKGQCLQSETTTPNRSITIDGSHLSNGLYFIKATQGTSTHTQKILKLK